MRKIILGLAISLDGFIEGPNGEYDWCFTDQDYGMTDFLESVDTIFYGRKSYELMMKTGGLQMYGNKHNYVFSNSLGQNKTEYDLIRGDVAGKVKAIKNSEGKNIWLFGGARLACSLINENLVDELWLSIHPIVLGKGLHLFAEVDKRINLKLTDYKAYETGLISCRYTILNRD